MILENFSVEFNSGIPVYKQIINKICTLVNSKILKEGDRLPTIRKFTEILGVNPNTVAKAYRELELRGIIASQRGSGCFVAPNPVVNTLSEEDKILKMDEIFRKAVAELNSHGITESEFLNFFKEK